MKKILVVDSWSGFGGGQRVAYDLLFGLQTKYRLTYMAPAGPYLECCRENGISNREIFSKQFADHVFEIRKVIKQDSPDIVHVHGTRAAVWTRLAVLSLQQRPKIIYTVHGFHLIHKKGLVRFVVLSIERFLNRCVDRLVCVSEHDCETIVHNKLIDPKKAIVILNSIDLAYWQQNAVTLFTSSIISDDTYVIGVIGRLHEPKDVATVLHAFAQLQKSILRPSVLLIVGDGPLRSSLETLSKELGIDRDVLFVGNQKDVRPFLKRCDAVVISSVWEGLCLVALEAAACKKPIVISNFDGVDEVVHSEQTGLVFPIGSSVDLKNQLIRLVNSPELSRTLGEAAEQFVTEQFSSNRMREAYQKIYEEV